MEQRNGEDDSHGSPEQREQLRLNSIVIPAHDGLPLRQGEIDVTEVEAYQQVVQGHLQLLTFEEPAASLYINEEGKLEGLPLNGRATMLLWMHNKAFRYHEIIVGDALLLGPDDGRGVDTAVPDLFVQTLLTGQRLHAEVRVQGDPGWYRNDVTFDQWTEAYAAVLDLGRQWSAVEDMRVVPAAD